jgi:alpha-N-arabinofuranosidase
MFSKNIGNEILPLQSTETSVQASATRDSKTGEIFIKLVNPEPKPESLQFELKAIGSLGAKARVLTLAAEPEAINSIDHPRNVVPAATTLDRLQPVFTYNLPPNSIVVLTLKSRP